MDKYDKAIEYLTRHPSGIFNAWVRPYDNRGGCLFARAAKTCEQRSANGLHCGCLTEVRAHEEYLAATPELTAAIRADERIPTDAHDITPAHLPVFAEWQRRLDRELGRGD